MLHIISHTPIEVAIFERIGPGDVVILIENAVLGALQQGALSGQLISSLCENRCCVLNADLEIRGIGVEELVPGVEVMNYSGFVELTVQNPRIQSWC
jgi:tRNA 2-thiouridine synthesizing protein B